VNPQDARLPGPVRLVVHALLAVAGNFVFWLAAFAPAAFLARRKKGS